MTWNTNLGKRVLEGAEAKFYLHILQAAVEFSQEAVELDDGVEVITTGISEDYVQNRLPKVTQSEADTALQKILDWQ